MPELSSLDAVDRLYAERGQLSYGEGVSQLEHALQCAELAEAAGASASLVAAALLHDIGHLLVEESQGAEIDDRHEIRGAQALKLLFDEAVRGPIALHVSAKRYLCFKEPGYESALSPASRHSLALQGGRFTAAMANRFEQMPSWREAVQLRRWDDLGKRQEPAGRNFADYAPLLHGLLREEPTP